MDTAGDHHPLNEREMPDGSSGIFYVVARRLLRGAQAPLATTCSVLSIVVTLGLRSTHNWLPVNGIIHFL